MNRLLYVLLSVLVAAAFFTIPANSQEHWGPTEVVEKKEKTIVVKGVVLSATDQDEDGENDTFVIKTGTDAQGNPITTTVTNTDESAEMGLIDVGEHVEVECTVQGDGTLKIEDVISIGQ